MKYSRSAHVPGVSGFFFDTDINIPADAVSVSAADMKSAIALTDGSTYDFDAAGVLTITPPNAGKRLADAQSAQIAVLSAACQAQIYAGFDSAALGAVHHYPAKDKDQGNLSGSVVSSLLPGLPADWTTPFWCQDSAGAWAFVPHSAAQIQQVGADGKAAIVAALEKNAALAAQVMAAASVAEVQAVVW